MAFNFLKRNKTQDFGLFSDDVGVNNTSTNETEVIDYVDTTTYDEGAVEATLTSQSYSDGGKANVYEKFMRLAIYLTAFFIPLFFLPWGTSVLELSKQMLLIVLAGVSLVLWLLSIVSSGKLKWRVNPVDKGVAIFLGATVLATVFSLTRFKSLFGLSGSLSNSLVTVLALTIIYFLSVSVFDDRGRSLKNYLGISLIIALIYEFFQIFGIYILRFDFAKAIGFNTIGSLDTFGVMAAMTLPFFAKNRVNFLGFNIAKLGLILEIALLIILNWWVLWAIAIAGMVAMILFDNMKSGKFKISRFILPMTVIVLGVFLIIVNFNITAIKNKFPLEVSPSYSLSTKVATSVLKDNLILGYGPENFSLAFDKYGAGTLSNTTLSGAKFFDSTSEIFNIIISGGLIAILSFAFLLWTLIWGVIRGISTIKSDASGESSGVLAMAFAAVVAIFLYPFNITLMLLFYMAVVLSVLSLWHTGKKVFNIEDRTWLSIVSSLGFIGGLIVALVGVYFGASVFMSDIRYSQALAATDVQSAANRMVEAINWDGHNDAYYRTASQAALALLSKELNDKKTDDQKNARIQNYIASSVDLAKRAVNESTRESLNWANLGNVYQNLIGLVDGVDTLAAESYLKASELRPGDSSFYTSAGSVYLTRSQLARQIAAAGGANAETYRKDIVDSLAKAEEYYKKAIDISPNYGLAIYNLGLIYDQEGKTTEAIKQLEKIMPYNSNQPGLAFELGLLYYRAGDKDKALAQIQRAVILSPDFANARWYLALIYEERKDYTSAIEQLNKILSVEVNKDNAVVLAKIEELKKGQSSIPPAKVTDQKPLP